MEAEAREARRGCWGLEPRIWPEWPEELNSVRGEWLEEIHGIGPITAARVIAYRDKHGPLTKVDDLAAAGIREPLLALLRRYLYVDETR